MSVKSHDEGHLARILVPEGERVAVGTPVALMCEDGGVLADQGFQGPMSPAEGKDARRTLTWQAYLKSRTGKGEEVCRKVWRGMGGAWERDEIIASVQPDEPDPIRPQLTKSRFEHEPGKR
jgi:pyruvate/2-oxoglutarate dehydrogenase complex dihydrolipoamide acyltransferase (E2) component